MKRYIAAALVMVGVMMAVGRAGPLIATPTTVVVSPGNMNGWAIVDDNGAGGGSGSLVSGPAVPPAGVGSARLQLGTPTAGWVFASPFAATPLGAFTTLSYSTYRASADAGNNLAISLQFNVDYDLTDAYAGYQGRILFEPYQTFPGGVPQGTWQTWNALAGKWWQTANPSNPARAPYVGNVQQTGPLPCPQSAPCTLATLIAAYPNIGVHATLGAVVLKAGSGWATFDGNADNLTIGTSSGTTIYDFEGDCTTDCYVRTDGNDANTGLADTAGQAKKTLQAAVNQVSAGGTVHVAAGTYVEQVDIGRQLTLDGAGAGSTIIQAPASLATKFTTSAANKPVVYVHASGGTISHLTVDGNGAGNANYRFEGIAFYNAGGTVSNSAIVHVRETPLGGNGHGVALYANNADAIARTLTVTNNTISDYQKNGMALNGAGLTATVSGNVVTGAGAFSGQAQNGIQIGYGAVGSITGNTVSGNQCTVIADCTADPTSATNADGAAGVLIYTPGTSPIVIKNNTLTGNQFGVWTVGATSLIVDGNTISGAGGTGVAVWDCDQWCGPLDAVGTTGTITNNTISGQGYGLLVRDFVAGAPSPSMAAHGNSVTGSTSFGAWANAATNATDNWWGSASGPQHASNTFNVGSQGDKVSDGVTFVPWLNAAPPAGVSFAPVTDTSPAGSFASIQAGVNASGGGGTVNAAAGTFTENVTVGTSVTIAGAGQASTTIVPAVSKPTCSVGDGGSLCAPSLNASNVMLVGANNVTVHDLTIDGNNPTMTSGVSAGGSDLDARNGIITNHPAGVWNNLTVHHVTVKNVYLRGMYASSGGTFNFHDDTVQNVQAEYASIAMFNFGGAGTFTNNTVSGANDAISSNWSKGTQYLNNTITGSGSGVHTDNNGGSGGVADLIKGNSVSACKTDGYGVWTFAPYVSPTVAQNTVTGCAVGMAAAGQQAAVTTTFSDNAVDGTGALVSSGGGTGAYITTDLFGFGTTNVSAVLTGNIIKNNGTGIDADSQAGYTTTINASRNAISGNGAGVALTDTPTPPVTLGIGSFVLNMTPNWWGDPSGPANATSNPASTGDSVPNGVVYSPWLGIGSDASGAPGFQLASPMTWIAGPAVCGATCIQAAIDDASNGDTVRAKSGVFNEHVTVNKAITLTAGSNPIIDGGGSGDGITITVPNVTVSSFEVRNVTNGIVVAAGANNATISANNVHAFHQRGVSLNGGTGLLVDGNTINGEGGGTTASPGTSPDTDTRYYGVYAVDSTGTISNNTIKGITHGAGSGLQSGVGIRAGARSGNSSNVTISNNTLTDIQKNAITVDNRYGGTAVQANVTNNSVTGNGPITYIAQNGIQVSFGATATVSGNAVSGYNYTPPGTEATGILLFQANASTVSGNNVHDNEDGVYVTSANNAISGNALRNNVTGAVIDYSSGAPTGNTFNLNCIAGNATAGMATLGTQAGGPVNAESNWWGRVNGPAPAGSGDAIDTPSTIDAVPFLTTPTATCAARLQVAGYPSPTVATVAHTFTVTAKDAYGNTDTMYTGTVHFTSSDYSASLPADYTFVAGDAGTHVFSATMNLPSLHDITATDTVSGITGSQAGIVVTLLDTDDDGCADVYELVLIPPTNGLDPWDFYSVPVPALFAAPNPLVVFRDSVVSAGDAQAVFAYFKAGAKTGKPVYEQDLNNNGKKDGIEYDRSVLGPGHSGPPDGVVGAADAQLAFAQFKMGYSCSY